MLHAFEQRANAAAGPRRHRPMILEREHEFLVFGADAEMRLGFGTLQQANRRVRRAVRSASGRLDHAPWRVPGKTAATLHAAYGGGQCNPKGSGDGLKVMRESLMQQRLRCNHGRFLPNLIESSRAAWCAKSLRFPNRNAAARRFFGREPPANRPNRRVPAADRCYPRCRPAKQSRRLRP